MVFYFTSTNTKSRIVSAIKPRHSDNKPSASLQKKRNYKNFSDNEENENNSSIPSKSKVIFKEISMPTALCKI